MGTLCDVEANYQEYLRARFKRNERQVTQETST